MKQYEFVSTLSPEEVWDALRTHILAKNALRLELAHWKARLKGRRLSISRVVHTRSEGVEHGGAGESGGVQSGIAHSRHWDSPFRGTLSPDGSGGSILRGHFGLSGVTWGILTGLALLCALSIALAPHILETGLFAVLAAGILIRSLQELLAQSEEKENSVKILELLREQLTENADEIESV